MIAQIKIVKFIFFIGFKFLTAMMSRTIKINNMARLIFLKLVWTDVK